MFSHSPAPSAPNEQLAAHAKAARLVGLPWDERLRCVREDRTFSVPSFVELAISLSRELDMPPREREEWGRLAVEATTHGGSSRVDELEPLAWANLGSCHRVRDRLWASRSAFMRCAALRHRIGNPLELAETSALEASYRWAIRELDNAAKLIDEALRLAMPYANDQTLARYEVQAGMIAGEARRWSYSIEKHLSALERIDASANPRLALSAAHNLAFSTVGIGHLDTAACALIKLGSTYDHVANPKALLKRDSLMASITGARGHWREAEFRFQKVREGFAECILHSEAAYTDLQLYKLAAQRGRWSAAVHFAVRAEHGFATAGSPRRAAAAARLHRTALAECRGGGASGGRPAGSPGDTRSETTTSGPLS